MNTLRQYIRLRRALAFVSALFVSIVLFFGAAPAFADEPALLSPRDVPLVVQPSGIEIPKVPESYIQEDHGWLRVSFDPAATARFRPLVASAEQTRFALSERLGQTVLDHVEVRVAKDADEMAKIAPVGVPPPDFASGVAYPSLHLILLSLAAPDHVAEATDLGEVFRHELAHIALEDATNGRHVPRWFNEGFAIQSSGEADWMRARTLWTATLSDTLLPLASLDRSFPNRHYEVNVAYAEAADFVRFLDRNADSARFVSLIGRVRGGQKFDQAARDAYDADLRTLEYQWKDGLSQRFTLMPALMGGSMLWVLVIAAMGYAYVKRKKRSQAILARWGKEEELHDARLRRRALEADLTAGGIAVEGVEGEEPTFRIEVPRVEHDGDWHTLH